MKTWEAVKALEEGKKIRKSFWDNGIEYSKYWYMNDDGKVVDETGDRCNIVDIKADDWEIYDDREELPSELEWVRGLSEYYSNVEEFNYNGSFGKEVIDEIGLCRVLKLIEKIKVKYKL